MPTSRTYSPSAAETLRRSLLALAATAATATAADPVRPASRLAGAPPPPPRADVRAADSVPQDSVSDAQELPAPADIARYEREASSAGDGRTHAVSKSDGDEILALLKDWRTFEDLRPKPRKPGEPVICILPPPPDLVLSCLPQDGPAFALEFYRHSDRKTGKRHLDVSLPIAGGWRRRIPDEPARALLAKLDAWDAADRAAFLAAPLPRTYVFGSTGWDGGTLSGVARLFYGHASKWRVIWEANKAAVPNPDYVLSGTSLVIPALPEPRLGGRLVPAPAPTNSSRAESGSTEASGN